MILSSNIYFMKRRAMSKFNYFKTTIFPDHSTQIALMNAIRYKGYSAKDFEEAFTNLIHKVDEQDLQTILAPFLRTLAIKHLREGTTGYVSEFRNRYDAVVGSLDTIEPGDAINVDAFLNQQSQAYVYATDLEAGALAEILGVTFACTQVGTNDLASVPPCIYYRSAEENAAIIHLYNRPGDHFFVVDGQYSSTVGDGNCLYNGFTQLMRQFILEEEQNALKVYVNQAQIYNQIKNFSPISITELVARIRMQHTNKADEADLNAAILIAQNDEKSAGIFHATEKKSDVTLSEQEQKFLRLIQLIREQGQALSTKDHLHKANRLANTLENKATRFFNLPYQDKQNRFVSFKDECLQEITKAKNCSNHRDYQQIFFDILQTLTIIGALIGVAQWFITGRYSLFPTPTTTLLDTIEKTKQTLTQLKYDDSGCQQTIEHQILKNTQG